MGKRISFGIILGFVFLFSCKNEDPKPSKPVKITTPIVIVNTPQFNQDTAYNFIQKQVDFGPRVPNTKAHENCANYLVKTLKNYGAKVLVQEGEVIAFNRDKLQIKNIIAQFSPEKKARVMLFAHWDTRPFADHDSKDKYKPIDGANDGGSGVGVLLEIARQISKKNTRIGVDIILFDAEDYGTFSGEQQKMADDWCLGSQYWAKNPPIANYHPKYGILLDIVGGKNAVFPKEYFSTYFAENIVTRVWSTAERLGYSNYFVNQRLTVNQGITDDHRYVNILAKIPSIDIISYDINLENPFGDFHHKHSDNMDLIDKNTLKAVGQTVMEVVYQEK